jgi:hypothetical protein
MGELVGSDAGPTFSHRSCRINDINGHEADETGVPQWLAVRHVVFNGQYETLAAETSRNGGGWP